MSCDEGNVSTASGGESVYAPAQAPQIRNERIGLRRLAAALTRLVCEREIRAGDPRALRSSLTSQRGSTM